LQTTASGTSRQLLQPTLAVPRFYNDTFVSINVGITQTTHHADVVPPCIEIIELAGPSTVATPANTNMSSLSVMSLSAAGQAFKSAFKRRGKRGQLKEQASTVDESTGLSHLAVSPKVFLKVSQRSERGDIKTEALLDPAGTMSLVGKDNEGLTIPDASLKPGNTGSGGSVFGSARDSGVTIGTAGKLRRAFFLTGKPTSRKMMSEQSIPSGELSG